MAIRFSNIGIYIANDLREYLNYLSGPYNRKMFYDVLTCFMSNVYKEHIMCKYIDYAQIYCLPWNLA